MFARISKWVRCAKVAANRRHNRVALIGVSGPSVVELLEQRVFLSVSDQTLAGPVGVFGNKWTYELDSGGSELGTETLTSKGTVSHNGLSAIEIDIAGANADGDATATEKIFYAFLPQGYVLDEGIITLTKGAVDDTVWSPPYHLIIPPTLDAMSPITTPTATYTDTQTPAGGTPTTGTGTKSDVITLTSATPNTSVTVNAGTFMCYEIDSTETTTTSGSAPTTDMSQTFVSPTDGLVEIKDLTTGNITQLTNFTGSTNHLDITRQPTKTFVSDPIDPSVEVTLEDPSGKPLTDTSDAVTVTASIGAGSTGTGTLSGITQVDTVRGVANFKELKINKPGQYTLNFTDSAGHTMASNSFEVTGGVLVFKRPIKDGTVGNALNPAVEVELEDNKHRPIIDSTATVTLSITGANSSNPVTGTSAALLSGVAVFSQLKFTMPDKYVLTATDDQNDTSAMSDPFEIKGLHLEFKKSPAETAVGAGLKYVLALEDPENKVITSDSTDGIGFFLNTVEGGTNATLTNTSDLLTRGVASNAETPPVTINSPGTYTITAKEILDTGGFSTTTESATSKEFVVAANKLVFTKQPGPKTFVDTRLNYVVELRNYKNQIVTTSSDQLQFTLNPVEGGAGAVLASNVDSLLAGIADDSNTSAPPLAINLPGTFTLSVIDVPPSPSDIAAKGALSKEFKVLPPIK